MSNIIIRNLTITGSSDGISTRRTHHIWIDHCDVYDCGDGLIDITDQSDLHTVSWTRFSNHHKTMLINSGTGQPEDRGTLNTTLHHNWWDGSDTRNPRAGYGKVHIYNCLYNNNDYYIGLHSECRVLVEKNYFNNTNEPINHMYISNPTSPIYGFCELIDNVFNNCTGATTDDGISFPVDDYYMYDFMLDSVNNVPSIVQTTNVGPAAEYEEIGLLPVPGNGATSVSTDPVLRWTKGQSATGYIVHFGTTNPPPEVGSITEQTYNPGSLSEGAVYYWRVDQDTSGSTIQGMVWTFRTEGSILGRPSVTINSPSSGSSFPYPSNITINADATDDDGTVTSVEFFEGPRSIGIDNSEPYSITWNDVTDGTYMLKTKVTDNDGNTYTSPIVTILVGDGGFPKGPEGYTFNVFEGETCIYTGTVNIAFGADGHFNYKYNVTSCCLECSNDVFGYPIYGTAKACFVQQVSTSVEEYDDILPSDFKIFQIYPNPFNPETKIHFYVSQPIHVSISAFDASGEYIGILFNQSVNIGEHNLIWNASDLTSGVYFIKLSSKDFTKISKCTLMK